MQKLSIHTDMSQCEWGVKLRDGRIVAIKNKDSQYYEITYGTPIDLKNEIQYLNEKEIPEGVETTTINDILKKNEGEAVFCYKSKDVEYNELFGHSKNPVKVLTPRARKKIINEFRKAGFKVTDEAILHNYHAWCGDMKSGYADEENGYHLFSPCGCNGLSFSATEYCGLDWQKTYEC